MAKSSKIKDPTEIALSAIQEALKIGNETPNEASRQPPMPANASASSNMPSPIDFRVETPAGDDFREPRYSKAANDDRETIGAMLQLIQKGRPRRTAYTFATLFSGLWIAAAGLLAYSFRPALEAMAGQQSGSGGTLALIGLAAVFFAPLVLFYFLASVAWRSQELTMIAQAMAQMALRFSEPERLAGDGMVSVGQAIRREVTAMGDGVERAIARASELEALVSTEVAALERAYSDNESKIRTLLLDINQQREGLLGQAEQVRGVISGVQVDLREDIAAISESITGRIDEAAQNITMTLLERGEQITQTINEAGDNMIVALGERGGDLIDRLEEAGTQTARAVMDASEHLTANLDFKTNNVHDEFADLADRIHDMLSERIELVTREFDEKSGAIVDGIAARTENVHEIVKTSGDNLLLDLDLRATDIANRIEETGARLADQMLAGGERANEALDVAVNALVAKVIGQSESTHELLNTQIVAFEGILSHQGVELAEKLARDSGTLGAIITRHISEFDRTVKTFGGDIVNRMGQHTQGLADNLKTHVETFDGRASSLDRSFDDKIKAFDGTVSTRFDGIRGNLETHATSVANDLEQRIQRFEGLLSDRVQAAAERIETSGRTAGSTLTEASDTIQASIRDAHQSFHTLSTDVSTQLSSASADIDRALMSSAAGIERMVSTASDALGQTLNTRVATITDSAQEKIDLLSAIIDDKKGLLIEAISAKTNELDTAISSVTGNALKTIETHGSTFVARMSDQSLDIAGKLNAAGETATAAVTKSLFDLQQTSQVAIDKSRDAATAAVTEMQETHNILRNDTVSLFERLREGNILLQEVLTGAHQNLNSLEHALVTRVANFVTTMNDVSEKNGTASAALEDQLKTFTDSTGLTIENLGALSQQFSDHGRAIAQAALAVEESNARTGATVADRSAALEDLVATLDTRTAELDDRLHHFTTLLEESLTTAEDRARNIAAVVTESATASSTAVGHQFEAVRMAVEDERRQTIEAMTEIYDAGTQEAGHMFQQAADKFADIVHGMRQMSAELHDELEATRTEMRRSVVEVPQEAAENTAQMRKVIVDQIEALAELNRIVERHGRGLDVAETGRSARREEETAMVTAEAPPRQVAPPAPLTPPRSRDGHSASSLPPPDLGFTGGTPRRTDAPPMSPASEPSRDKWMNDLLSRAESDFAERDAPPPRTPRSPPPAPRPANTIETLALDITRLIDRDMAAEMWERYQRGERKAFTKRLYTPAGQKAYDEVGRKYRADRTFKQTVDRYITEFERLLDDVSRDDRGPGELRNHLASEAGLVYTLLAHAAGRLG